MDYARKIGRGSNNVWAKNEIHDRIPQERLFERSKILESTVEDRRLSNWKRWLNDRARIQKRLSEKLNRKPLDLALNAHERVRLKAEARCLMESAVRSEVANQNKYRGNPAFWRVADRIKINGEKIDEDVSVTLSRADKCLPPDVTKVALPEYIKREKMLVQEYVNFEKINVNSKWDCGEYLQQRRADLRKEIELLDPYPPEMDDLVVIGKNFNRGDRPKLIRTPVITITPELTKKIYLNNPDERIALKIENREFVLEKGRHFERLSAVEIKALRHTKQVRNNKKYAYSTIEADQVYLIQPKKPKPITWDLNFESRSNETSERKLIFENRGVQIVNIDWRNVTPFESVPVTPRTDSQFFFNKNCVQILPGQKLEMPIWFRSKKAAVATETWKILTEPKVYPGLLKVRLWGVANGEDLKTVQNNDRNEIKEYIRLRTSGTMIREIIEELFTVATMVKIIENDIPYEMFFLKTDIFHARNPSHSYRSTLVNELNKMYKHVLKDDTIWSLSLDELRSILLAIEDPVQRRQQSLHFRQICDKLLRPNLVHSRPNCPKKRLACWLFGFFLNSFEVESEFAKTSCCFKSRMEEFDEEEEDEGEEKHSEIVCLGKDLLLYDEIFFVRIKCLLDDTIYKICAAIDSQDYFNKDGFQ